MQNTWYRLKIGELDSLTKYREFKSHHVYVFIYSATISKKSVNRRFLGRAIFHMAAHLRRTLLPQNIMQQLKQIKH